MRAISSCDTAIERRLADLLTMFDLRFNTQDGTLPGRPDFVLPEYQAVIFTHSCFWHRHQCNLFKIPATRTEFWLKKINANVCRDNSNRMKLNTQGWRVLVVWECAMRGRHKLSDEALQVRLEEWICAGGNDSEIDSSGLHLCYSHKDESFNQQ